MSQPHYYPTECPDPVADEKLSCPLPRIAEPISDEALPSWLLRFTTPLSLLPLEPFFAREETRFADDRSWWRHPKEDVLTRMAARTAINTDILRAMTFTDWIPDRSDCIPQRFARGRIQHGLRPFKPTAQYGVCPVCLADTNPPYVRKLWTVGWIVACELHTAELVQSCSYCRGMVKLPPFRSRGGSRLAAPHCRCKWSTPQIPIVPAHSLAMRVQSQLLLARSGGYFEWPGLAPLTWAAAVALIDLILGVMWIGSRAAMRQHCLVRIERDLQLNRRLTHRSHDGLLVAAWVLEEWPGRLDFLVRELRVAEPRRQLLLWQPMPESVSVELNALILYELEGSS